MRQLPALLPLVLLTACAHHAPKQQLPKVPQDKAIQTARQAVIEKGEQSEATADAAHYFPVVDGKGWKILVKFANTFGFEGGHAIVKIDENGKVTSYKPGG